MKIRTVSIILIALAALLAGCGSDSEKPAEKSPTPTAPTLEGTWRTEPITLDDAEATLRKHGLGKYIKKIRTDPPFEGETVLILDVNVTNNSTTVAPRTRQAARKWSLAWLVWLQDHLLTYGFFV